MSESERKLREGLKALVGRWNHDVGLGSTFAHEVETLLKETETVDPVIPPVVPWTPTEAQALDVCKQVREWDEWTGVDLHLHEVVIEWAKACQTPCPQDQQP